MPLSSREAKQTCRECKTELREPIATGLCGLCDPSWDPLAALAQIISEKTGAPA